MVRSKAALLALVLMSACGKQEARKQPPAPSPIESLRNELLKLQAEISAIVSSDYSSCGGALSSAAQKICQIAQAATVEVRTEMRGALSDLASQLESRIDSSGKDVDALAGSWKQIYGVPFPDVSGAPTPTEADCLANNATASLIKCMQVQQSAIDALQSAVTVLSDAVTGAMTVVEVGTGNVDAGPLYEQLVRLSDKSRINAYTDGLGPIITVGSNPIDPTTASSSVVITT